MATVCMLGHPAAGHINPTLPLIAELVRRGERVIYYATDPFRTRIEHTGAIFRSYGDHERFERNLGFGGMLGGMAGAIAGLEDLLPGLISRVASDAPDYLLAEAHALAAHYVTQRLDRPAVSLASMFAVNRRLIAPIELARHLYGHQSASAVLAGLHAFAGYFETARRVDAALGTRSPDMIGYLSCGHALNIVFTSREFQVGVGAFDDSYCFVGPPTMPPPDTDDDVFAWLDGRPLIYIAMGTMYNDEPTLYRNCVEAFRDADVQVVISTGQRIDAAVLPDTPRHIVLRPHVPQWRLLERAALFITHGGINSAHEAMLHGVPMLVLPRTADHHVVAGRVAEIGAGVALARDRATSDTLQARAKQLLDTPSYAAQSRAMGDTLRRAGGPVKAADAIARFVAHSQKDHACSIR